MQAAAERRCGARGVHCRTWSISRTGLTPASGNATAMPPVNLGIMVGKTSSWASSPAVRRNMQANRARDTGPELAIRSALFARGLRYRVNLAPLPDTRRTADIAFTRAKVAVFVDGCFWHGCPEHHSVSKTNPEYWSKKVLENRRRDADTDTRLTAAQWISVRIWEHESVEEGVRKILEALAGR